MTQLTEQFHLPQEHHAACDRLTELIQHHTRRLLETEYWDDAHIDALSEGGQSYTYIRDHDYDAFEIVDEYVYSRFKRCVYHRITSILDAHGDEYHAFRFVRETVEERKIQPIGWRRIRGRLFEDDTPYIEWPVLETVVEQINNFYERHGRFPNAYTELVDCPEPNGTLPYAPDKGDYHIHELSTENGELRVVLNAPDSLSPDSHYDWTDHEIRFPTHSRFQAMLATGDVGAPTLHESEHGYTLDVPVEVSSDDCETNGGRVLSVDLGIKKQATAVVLEPGCGDTHTQVTPPKFIDHPVKDKLLRVKADSEGINDRLAELRRQGKSHTDRFSHLLAEYRQTRRKERRLRRQIQHDVANQLVWLAVDFGCETLVFESLGQIETHDTGSVVAWSIASWARGELLDFVEYKAELVGISVETVNPWGTSRYCPRCGERGRTVKSPTDHTERRHGGHFHCPECDYECDRDVVGAINVGRKHLSECQMEMANPADYTSAGNHASFPSHTECARSAGVQSVTDKQDQASGRQTHLSQFRPVPLTSKHGGTKQGRLSENRSSETGVRTPSGSVTQYILASQTECG